MTISAVIPAITFSGSSGAGTLGPFSLIKSGTPISFTANSQIKVYRYGAVTDLAPDLLVENTDYTLTGGPIAGSITLTSPQTGLLTDERLHVYREQPYTQPLDLANSGSFSSANLEARMDRLTEMVQEVKRDAQTSVRFTPLSGDSIPSTMPLDAAIDKLVYISGTASSPVLATINSPADLLASIAVTAENITNINLVGTDLGGADTIGVVAADLAGDNTIGDVAAALPSLIPALPDIQSVAGSLGSIGSLLGGQVVKVDTLSDLQDYTPTDGQLICLVGRVSAGDGGGGMYRFSAADLSAEVSADEITPGQGDGRNYIAPASDRTGASGAWVATQFNSFYILQSSVSVVRLLADGNFSPSSVTFSALEDGGLGTVSAYAGRFRISTSTDGVTYTQRYDSASNESSTAFTIPSGAIFIKCQLYRADGFTSELQQFVASVIRDGVDGSSGAGTDAVVVNLSKSSAAVFAYADGTVPSFEGIDGQVTVFDGTADETASASFSVSGSGLTGQVNTAADTPVTGQPKGYYRVVSMSADIGALTITTTYGGVNYVRSFSVSKIRTGYEIVATLPSTNLFEGRIVFLTTDDKLYRYTGTAWTAAVASSDLTGQIVESQISDAAVTTAKFAASIEPVSIVSSLPGSKSTSSVFNTTDGFLYRWDGAAYVKAVPAADVTGTFTDAQIADLSAAKITGTITETQIGADAITTAKIAAGAIVAGKIAANAVTATTIAAGSVETAKISAGAVTATQIAANTITAGQIATGAIATAELSAGAVTASKIAAGTITANEIAANTITAGKIAAATITATQLASNAITADKISAGAVTAAKVSVTSLAAMSANLGAVTAGSLNINSKFIVASDGTVTIRNATTGQRLVISNTTLEVYDSSNVRRVRLGIW
jgi:hypothetical protein